MNLKTKHSRKIRMKQYLCFFTYALVVIFIFFVLLELLNKKPDSSITELETDYKVESYIETETIQKFTNISKYSFIKKHSEEESVEELLEETTKIDVEPEMEILDVEPVEEDIVMMTINYDFDILTPCGYSLEELQYCVSSPSHKNMSPYVDVFLEAEQEYGVNALYLMCTMGLESGWFKHETGKNNMAGWTSSTSPSGWRDFESIEECIYHVASVLSTSYKEKVGTRLEDVCYRYCPTEGYVDKIIQIMKERQYVIETYENIDTPVQGS